MHAIFANSIKKYYWQIKLKGQLVKTFANQASLPFWQALKVDMVEIPLRCFYFGAEIENKSTLYHYYKNS